MAVYGYGNVQDRAFVAFARELDDGAWNEIDVAAHEGPGKDNAAALLFAPPPVIWKLRLRWGIGAVLAALGAPAVGELDEAWDATQRRLFHRIAIGVDDENRTVRAAADRLRAGLLVGMGTGQTSLDYDAEVDFGRQQLALTKDGGPLAADAKKLKLEGALEEVEKATEALAKALGRGTGEKRKSPSRRLREAVAECAGAFNLVHDEIAWFVGRMPAGAERDGLGALLLPMTALLARSQEATPKGEVGGQGEAGETG